MCVPYDSTPPVAPISGAAIDTQDLVLASRDGTKFAAYHASAGRPGSAGVVVMPDVRGLFRFYEQLADRFAEQGMDAVAIDYFGRTAGVGKRGEDFPFMEHVQQTRAASVAEDVGAAVKFLRQSEGDGRRAVFTVGFCFGGSNSWLQAAAGHGLAGAIGFYGRPTSPGWDGSAAPIDRAAEFACPVLALMGGADQGIPVSDVERFERELERAGKVYGAKVYEGAPHSFFDRRYEEFSEASADAWERVLDFMSRHSS